uniref:Uncharacterized protein n=1 Tax=Tetranychus urticae TaxID=32264 RepID=T1KUM3_TETUR
MTPNINITINNVKRYKMVQQQKAVDQDKKNLKDTNLNPFPNQTSKPLIIPNHCY